MSQGEHNEARKIFHEAIKHNNQECGAYYGLSMMLETKKDAKALLELIKEVNIIQLSPTRRSFIEFATANCYHKLEEYGLSADHLTAANRN